MVIKLGIIGSGYMAREYLRAAKIVKDVEITTLISRNKLTAKSLAKEFAVPMVLNRIDDIKFSQVDVLVICVSETSTLEVVAECLSLGVPLLVEKPLGLTLSEALLLEHKALTSSIPVFVALNRRFYASTLCVMRELDELSSKRYVHVVDQEDTIAAKAAGVSQRVVENWSFANSIHIIDYISFLCRGEPKLLSKDRIDLSSQAFIVKAEIEFSLGDFASYMCYWNAPAGWRVDINVEDTAWQLAPLENARRRELQDRKYVDYSLDVLDLEYKPGLVRLLEDVVKFMNGNSHSLVSIVEGNRTMRLIEMIYSDA